MSPQHDTPCAPEEVLDWAMRHADPRDDASVEAMTPLLRGLLANRTLLVDALTHELKCWSQDGSRMTNPQVIQFGRRSEGGKAFMVRAVLWGPAPAKVTGPARALQDTAYSYIIPHDHNFSLLTGGYHGPGYRTTILEYDRSKVMGRPGESIEMRPLDETQLAEGQVLFYRPMRHIHAQYHPDALSVSLNLLGEHESLTAQPQYEFSLDKRQLVGLLEGSVPEKTVLLFDMLAELGDDAETYDLLCHIGERHALPYVRRSAMSAAFRMCPAERERLRLRIEADPHPWVRDVGMRFAD